MTSKDPNVDPSASALTYGYARVSAPQSELEPQMTELHSFGVPYGRMYTDYRRTGSRDEERPGLRILLSLVREGDTIVVVTRDRIARQEDTLKAILERGVKVVALRG